MRELLKALIETERAVEELANEQKCFKPFYTGYLKGLRDARTMVNKEIFKEGAKND